MDSMYDIAIFIQTYMQKYQQVPSIQVLQQTWRLEKREAYYALRCFAIYQYVHHFCESKRYSPSRQEIADALHLSKTSTHDYIKDMIKARLLIQTPGTARSLRTLPLTAQKVAV